MYCLKCGKEIPEESNYCLYCGVLQPGKDLTIVKTGQGKALIEMNCNKEFGWGWYKIKIFIDGELIKTVKNGASVSFEIDNGKHIVYCESSWCKRSVPIEIIANSNKISFSVAFPPAYTTFDYTVILTKTKETEAGTWE
jgi:hypothetical protein